MSPESRILNPVPSTTPPTILAYPPSFVKRHGVRSRQAFRQDVGCQGGGLSGNNCYNPCVPPPARRRNPRHSRESGNPPLLDPPAAAGAGVTPTLPLESSSSILDPRLRGGDAQTEIVDHPSLTGPLPQGGREVTPCRSHPGAARGLSDPKFNSYFLTGPK